MAAPKGNNYNEVWPIEKAKDFLLKALKKLREDKEIYFIGTLAVNMNSYKTIFSYLVDKYKEKDKDFVTIKKEIDSIIEERLYSSAIKNKVNTAMAIFGLKNNHDWKDKSELETTNKTTIIELPKEYDKTKKPKRDSGADL